MPGPPELREPVEEQDERPLTELDDVEARTARAHRPMPPRALDLDDGLVGGTHSVRAGLSSESPPRRSMARSSLTDCRDRLAPLIFFIRHRPMRISTAASRT